MGDEWCERVVSYMWAGGRGQTLSKVANLHASKLLHPRVRRSTRQATSDCAAIVGRLRVAMSRSHRDVERKKFRPNVNAQRNKRQSDGSEGPPGLERLLSQAGSEEYRLSPEPELAARAGSASGSDSRGGAGSGDVAELAAVSEMDVTTSCSASRSESRGPRRAASRAASARAHRTHPPPPCALTPARPHRLQVRV